MKNLSALRLKRLRAGLSQAELAARSGMCVSSIKLYESGRRVPSRSRRERLDAALAAALVESLRGDREAS